MISVLLGWSNNVDEKWTLRMTLGYMEGLGILNYDMFSDLCLLISRKQKDFPIYVRLMHLT